MNNILNACTLKWFESFENSFPAFQRIRRKALPDTLFKQLYVHKIDVYILEYDDDDMGFGPSNVFFIYEKLQLHFCPKVLSLFK